MAVVLVVSAEDSGVLVDLSWEILEARLRDHLIFGHEDMLVSRVENGEDLRRSVAFGASEVSATRLLIALASVLPTLE